MSSPRLEIDLDKIHHNARTLTGRLARRGIAVTGVVKATLGSAEIANVLLNAGVETLGDSRIENLKALRMAHIHAPLTLIRSPMLSQAEQVVMYSDSSHNTEIEVIRALSAAATKAQVTHGIILMVELGDLREGIMPCDLPGVVRQTAELPNIRFIGIGANLACRSGVTPDRNNMEELSRLADEIDSLPGAKPASKTGVVSGGNSANLQWVTSCTDCGRVNNLRLGESILLGCDPLQRQPLDGLHSDAIVLVAEVIESNEKPSMPWGDIAQNAFGETVTAPDRGRVHQSILAIGEQDTDPEGLVPSAGIAVLGASSDHLIIESSHGPVQLGAEVSFGLNYSALLRAMTSPFVHKAMKGTRYDAAGPNRPPIAA